MSDVKRILLEVVKLRTKDWGRVCAAASSNTTPDKDSNCSRELPHHVNEEHDKAVLANILVHFLGKLSSSAKSFDSEVERMTTALNSWVTSEELLQELVEQLFTQSIGIPKFANTAARLCDHLAHHLVIRPSSGSFRQLLLKRCRLEYEHRDAAVRGDAEARHKFHLFVQFAAQLYLHLEVMSAKGPVNKAAIFWKGLKNIVISLLSNPVRSNVDCAAELLKLTGPALEDAWTAAGKPYMDELVENTEKVLMEADCSRNVKRILLEVVKLRTNNWGRVHAPAAAFTEVL